ncbi:hypothetical protein [Mucilaginibacter myungsuensis]|uniref:Uncharacterized protein n=1 Tax=Mucilaginibacter myungsuensis TaxID=649104 RepID=A0A929KRR2_9SPHI|nr:hypothetical protein [Mucilaginibacter myungsuensis]MBE9660294.1 hypothetical protein [Mucilaginibacter myungsuensis]MDN3600336.1 hypothetical protein [Mucilaginibacter myungsuensis]
MQTNITNISIPTPCHQQWDAMTPSQGGRHCDSCCKTVTDFTRMSDGQVIDFLSRSQNTCGRIEPWQISSVNRQLAQPLKQQSYRRGVVATVLLMFAVASGHAQTKLKAKQIHKTEVAKPILRAKPDSMVIYHPALKFNPKKDPIPIFKKEVSFPAVENTGAYLGGVSVKGIGIVDQNIHPLGFFNSIEDLLQVPHR